MQSHRRPTTWRGRINNAAIDSEILALDPAVVEVRWVVSMDMSASRMVESHIT